ncbi:MAG: hypothetical protein M4579_005223 [Chaenotheca gracillima]|nr:MAG: hypothetical protein M4579_005223 [Chaenotheca gracillima]
MAQQLPSMNLESFPKCQSCAKRSDWDFVKEMFERERFVTQRAHILENRNEQLSRAMQETGATQQHRVRALQDQIQAYDVQFATWHDEQVKLNEALQEARQEWRASQEALQLEKDRHHEAEQELDCLRNTTKRMSELLETYNLNTDRSPPPKPFDVAAVMMENEVMQRRIEELNAALNMLNQTHAQESATVAEGFRVKQAELEECIRDLLQGKKSDRIERELRITTPKAEGVGRKKYARRRSKDASKTKPSVA